MSAKTCQLPNREMTDYVCLAVIDEGEGMDQRTLARATEPFFTTKGIGKGTGLGLSMIRGMVEQCGGEFRLYSEKGRGTKAEIRLPAAELPPRDADASSEAGPAQVKPLRIVAVDDDAIVLLNTVTTLSDFGHEVSQASSGEAALKILADGQADLLVSDYAMPGINGGELVEQARKLEPDLKAIILSGYADLPEGVALDIPRLAKPFTDRELAHIIAAVCE